jgi:hypothetical protein
MLLNKRLYDDPFLCAAGFLRHHISAFALDNSHYPPSCKIKSLFLIFDTYQYCTVHISNTDRYSCSLDEVACCVYSTRDTFRKFLRIEKK